MRQQDAQCVIKRLGRDRLGELATFAALSERARLTLVAGARHYLLQQGDVLYHAGDAPDGFYVVLSGCLAFYKYTPDYFVCTSHYHHGEQIGFDAMITMYPRTGTAVATEDTQVLHISHQQFFDLHQQHSEDFGILMINLSRELSREIVMLEDVIGQGTGWLPQNSLAEERHPYSRSG